MKRMRYSRDLAMLHSVAIILSVSSRLDITIRQIQRGTDAKFDPSKEDECKIFYFTFLVVPHCRRALTLEAKTFGAILRKLRCF